jgi:hypothetical protein
MAINATNIAPIDRIPSKAVGISIPFNGPAVFKSNYTTKDATRNNLINLLLTFIFEQMGQNNIDGIQEYIEVEIARYFPNIQATVELRADQANNSLFTVINYTITNTGVTDTIQLNLTNG